MNIEQRLQCITEQQRAYIQGTVEFVNDEWVFFDEEEEEALLLEEMTEGKIELFRYGQWLHGYLRENGTVDTGIGILPLQTGDRVRFHKRFSYAYQQWLAALPDHTFFQFVQWLNKLGFSLYDCLYCYNGLLFAKYTGVNFIIYDNTELISNVQHYYERGNTYKDHFEITFNNGERFICTQFG
ncbi:DUF2777 domain-containing protein [Saccharococcus caldoxylosilyticus]|uniref:DUF2777 domain-containing protein n=1 Tax=Saccharococcus caldoxylosilyticus TaxID=81408 RepID=A0A150M0I5_9BACL|nr:DUF2777 domain-containing protein [Parageobacillus caldoxylosilyticus]KYD18067.1 hypothetical protein B4119_0761 [Parageobacillus caldoxylosilyticus]